MTIQQASSRHARLIALFLLLGLLGSYALAFLASHSRLAEPRLEIVAYLAEDSTSEVFFSDEYGNVSVNDSQSFSSLSGINRVVVNLVGPSGKESFAYRFDPCTCTAPIVIGGVSLVSAFVATDLPVEVWVAGGASTLSAHGTYFVLQDFSALADPQVIIFPDVAARLPEMKTQTFWTVFFFSVSVTVGGAVLLWAAVRKRGNRRHDPPPHLGSLKRSSERLKPPWWLLVLSLGLGLAGVFQQVYGAIVSGVTLDEPVHVEHLSRFFESGTYSSDAYGPVTALFGHTLNVVLDIEQWGVLSTVADAYVVRHLAIAILGMLTTFSVAVISRVVLGHWGWAFIAGGLLYSFPVWVGHSMFNIKDVPLAAGFTMFTAGLAILVSQQFRRHFRVPVGTALLIFGFLVGAGTRPIGIVLMLASLVVLGLMWTTPKVLNVLQSSKLSRSVWVFFLGVFSLLTIGIVNLGLATDFLSTNFDYPWDGWNLYGGERVESRPGLWAVIGVYSASTPLFLGGLVVIGLIALLATAVGKNARLPATFGERATHALVGFQGLGAFLAVLFFDPVLYDSARQILFVLPALAIIATVGMYVLVTALSLLSPRSRMAELMLGVAVTVGLVVPMVNQVQLFPYNYSFYNVIAQGAGINGSWETDYWGSSIREAAEVVAPGDPVTCRSVGDLNLNIGELEPCPILAPYVGGSAVAKESVLRENHFWVIRIERTLNLHGPMASDNCEFHSQVTRPLRGEDVSMAWAYQCEDR